MLVITAQIWPQGDVDKRFEIARIGIINRGDSQRATIADYNVVSLLGRDKEEYVKEGVVLAYPRHRGWRLLTSLALLEQGPSIFHPEYTQTVTDLLKKG